MLDTEMCKKLSILKMNLLQHFEDEFVKDTVTLNNNWEEDNRKRFSELIAVAK